MKRPAAYWAGILDGEGRVAICHIRCGRDRYLYHRVFVQISNTHLPLLKAIQKEYGGSILLTRLHKNRPNCKPVHLWTLACRKAMAFLESVKPFLLNKKAQADLAIRCQRSFIGEGRGFYRVKNTLFNYREKLRMQMLRLNHRGTTPYKPRPSQLR